MHKALEEVNAVRDCCRRMYMSFVHWVDAKMYWEDANAIRSLYDTMHTKVARICANPYVQFDGGANEESWMDVLATATSKATDTPKETRITTTATTTTTRSLNGTDEREN